MELQEARDYQVTAINQIREQFVKGNKKVLLWLSTGAGKTFIFSKMIKSAAANGKKCLVVVRGRKLVDQASQRLYREKVEHGVLMSGHWQYRPHLPVQVASIDTLIARKIKPEADLIIVDEAHMATSGSYKEFLKQYNTYVVAVTATPHVDGGLSHLADAIIHPITMSELTKRGFLVPLRCFAPSEPDLSEVKVSASTKDYVNGQLEIAMTAKGLTGNVVEHWKKIARGKPTICFAVNIHHSHILTDNFLAAGVRAEHCDAGTSDSERDSIIKRLETGQTEVVCNVGIFCTGVDIPCLGAIIMARPTKSRNLYVQQAGRGTRTFEQKESCIILDHAGNAHRHGLPTDEVEVCLDGREKKITDREIKTCKECFAVYIGTVCPECGVAPEVITKPVIVENPGELREIIETDPILREHKRLLNEARRTGRKSAWAHYRLVEKYTLAKCAHLLPMWFVDRQSQKENNPFAGSPFKSRFPTLR